MEKPQSFRRICSFCGEEFELTKNQMRQKPSKWPVNCSRTCAKKKQHEKNHGHIRSHRKCLVCSKEFTVTNWDKDKVFCSTKCSAINRFGNPIERMEKMKGRSERILNSERLLGYLKGISRKIAFKYNIESDDIMQDFFLALAEGQNQSIEHVAFNRVKYEYKKGMIGDATSDRVHVDIDALSMIRENESKLNPLDFVEYLYDLKSVLSESEFKVVFLALKGFNKRETYEKIRGDITRRDFYKIWTGKIPVQIEEKDYSTWGDLKITNYQNSSKAGAVYFD